MALHSSSWRTRLAGVVRFIFFSIVNILENAKVASTFYFMVVASSAIALFLFVCCVLLYMCFSELLHLLMHAKLSNVVQSLTIGMPAFVNV